VTITGTGFPPGAPVIAELFSDPVTLGSGAADANGAFRLAVTIPLDTSPGLHTLRVRTADGSVSADTTIAVTGPGAANRPFVAAGDGSLSRTGSEVIGPARLAFGLVVIGFVLVGMSWKERSATAPHARPPEWRGGRRRWF
jgi:hypothetical protein